MRGKGYPGSWVIKTGAILMIVIAVLGFAVSIFGMAVSGAVTFSVEAIKEDQAAVGDLNAMLDGEDLTADDLHSVGRVALLISLLSLAYYLYEFVIAIIGLCKARKVKSAKTLLVLGIISLVFSIAMVFGSDLDWTDLLYCVPSLIFCAGAFINLRARAQVS